MATTKTRRRLKAAKWSFMVENPDARDPQEVVYRLVQIKNGDCVERQDGFISGCERGWADKVREALTQPLLMLDIPKVRARRVHPSKMIGVSQ